MNESMANISIPTSFLWIVLLITIVVFIVSSLVLSHHWKYYGIKGNEKIFVKKLYFIISIILLLGAVLLISFYQIS